MSRTSQLAKGGVATLLRADNHPFVAKMTRRWRSTPSRAPVLAAFSTIQCKPRKTTFYLPCLAVQCVRGIIVDPGEFSLAMPPVERIAAQRVHIPRGVEDAANFPENLPIYERVVQLVVPSAAQSSPNRCRLIQIAKVIAAWPRLSRELRERIKALADGHGGR